MKREVRYNLHPRAKQSVILITLNQVEDTTGIIGLCMIMYTGFGNKSLLEY